MKEYCIALIKREKMQQRKRKINKYNIRKINALNGTLFLWMG
jgi:hypothetical protein